MGFQHFFLDADVFYGNSRIADEEIVNFYYPQPLHLERVYVGVHYRTPPYRVRQAILSAVSRVRGVLEKPSPAIYVHGFDDSAITYECRAWIGDIASKPKIESQIRGEIWEEFHRRGITIPFPIRTLEIEPRAARIEIKQPPVDVQEARSKSQSAVLFVERGPDSGSHLTFEGTSVTIGRSSGCELRLTERNASKQHCRIELRAGSYTLVDLESQNGTLVNGSAVTEQTLRDLDRIEIGDTTVVFESHG